MSLMLLKRSVEVLVGAALVTLMLAVLPAVAEAKEGTEAATHEKEAQSAKRGAEATHAVHTVVVVRPGDSLWSISEERLGPNATAQRIDRETERLWALNRERIGADPNLILPGQVLSVPPVGRSSTSSTTGSPAEGEAVRTPKKTLETANGVVTEANKAGQVPEQASERATLPDAADAELVPAARPLTSDPISTSPSVAVVLVAWALLAVIAALVTWVLLTGVTFLVSGVLCRRGRKREVRKRGALQAVLGTNYTRFNPLWGSLLDSEEMPWRPPSAKANEEGNGLDHLGLLAAARARRARMRRGRTGRVARAARQQRSRASSVGAYGPDVFRAVLRARRPQPLRLTKLNGRATESARRPK